MATIKLPKNFAIRKWKETTKAGRKILSCCSGGKQTWKLRIGAGVSHESTGLSPAFYDHYPISAMNALIREVCVPLGKNPDDYIKVPNPENEFIVEVTQTNDRDFTKRDRLEAPQDAAEKEQEETPAPPRKKKVTGYNPLDDNSSWEGYADEKRPFPVLQRKDRILKIKGGPFMATPLADRLRPKVLSDVVDNTIFWMRGRFFVPSSIPKTFRI